MADFRISDKPAYSGITADSADYTVVEDVSEAAGTYRKATASQVMAARDLIATGNGTSNTMYIDTSVLPEGDLEIAFTGRSDAAAVTTGARLQVGTTSPTLDTGANYTGASCVVSANTPAALTSADGDAISFIYLGNAPATNAGADQVIGGTIYIPDYKNTTFYKTGLIKCYSDFNDASRVPGQLIFIDTGFQWRNTSAIGVVGIYLPSGNWTTGSIMRARVF